MAASEEESCGPMSLMKSMERELECAICYKDQEDLRCLPCCQQLYCLNCLQDIFSRSDQPVCSYCSKVMTKNPEEYVECKLAKHFQRCMTTLRDRMEKDANKKCQVVGCGRPIDFCCKCCKAFLCFRCKDSECRTEDDQHDAVDIRDCVVESKETFELWRESKSQKLLALSSKKKRFVDEARDAAQQLVDAPLDESVFDVVERTATLLSRAHKDLLENQMEMEQEKSSKRLMDTMKNIVNTNNEVGLIHFVEQLQIYEQTRHLTLGDYEGLVSNVDCYDMSISPAGHLVVARAGGLDILNVNNGEHIKSVEFEEGKYGFVVEPYKDTIVVAVSRGTEEDRAGSEVVIYDMEYNEIRRWAAPRGSCDLAVVDNRVFISGADPYSGNIKVFSLNGEPAPDIIWNGRLACIASIPPCSIVFGDAASHKVYKQQVASGKRGITWSASALEPRCMCLDDNGLVWIRSNEKDGITVLSRQGDQVQEIKDDKVTGIGEITDLCIHDGYLYVSHHKGIGRFKLYYDAD